MSDNQTTFYSSKILHVADLENNQLAIEEYISQQTMVSKPQINWLGNTEESFGIDAVRDLQEQLAYSRSPAEEWWFIIANGDNISVPAQNALLKLLEEPPPQTHVCIITTHPQQLLPTIQSRCQTISIATDSPQNSESKRPIDAPNILEQTYAQLIDTAAEFTTKAEAKMLFAQLQKYLYEQLKRTPTNQTLTKQLQILQTGHELLYTNINIRILVEHILFNLKQKV